MLGGEKRKKKRRDIETGQEDRERAGSDQYSNCKMNLTGARTSHQMGKEIGYERWPAIKSDFPQCHLSDSGRGIMTTANESWALVRLRFKSGPPPRCADSEPCPPPNPGCHRTKEQRTLDIVPSRFKHVQKIDKGVGNTTCPERGLWNWSNDHGSGRTIPLELEKMWNLQQHRGVLISSWLPVTQICPL